MASNDALRALQERIGYAFADDGVLREALTHSSAVADGRKDLRDNERLEFLGDRVLGLVVAEHLHRAFPLEGEGKLKLRLDALVDRDACARAARRIELGAALALGKSVVRDAGAERDNILADACEALIAAVYLDGGLGAAKALIERAWADELSTSGSARVSPKNALQEWAAQRRKLNPSYSVISRSGPDHEPSFVVQVEVAGVPPARGEGRSKQEAERAAAVALLAELGVHV